MGQIKEMLEPSGVDKSLILLKMLKIQKIYGDAYSLPTRSCIVIVKNTRGVRTVLSIRWNVSHMESLACRRRRIRITEWDQSIIRCLPHHPYWIRLSKPRSSMHLFTYQISSNVRFQRYMTRLFQKYRF